MKNERSYVSASADLIYGLCVRHHRKERQQRSVMIRKCTSCCTWTNHEACQWLYHKLTFKENTVSWISHIQKIILGQSCDLMRQYVIPFHHQMSWFCTACTPQETGYLHALSGLHPHHFVDNVKCVTNRWTHERQRQAGRVQASRFITSKVEKQTTQYPIRPTDRGIKITRQTRRVGRFTKTRSLRKQRRESGTEGRESTA